MILECTDVHVEGLIVDYDPPAFYQGTVLHTSSGAGTTVEGLVARASTT